MANVPHRVVYRSIGGAIPFDRIMYLPEDGDPVEHAEAGLRLFSQNIEVVSAEPVETP